MLELVKEMVGRAQAAGIGWSSRKSSDSAARCQCGLASMVEISDQGKSLSVMGVSPHIVTSRRPNLQLGVNI